MQVFALLLAFLGAATGPPMLAAVGIAWIAAAGYCGVALDHRADRERIERWLLRYPARARLYRRIVDRCLRWLQAKARPDSGGGRPPPQGLRQQMARALDFEAATEADAERTSSNPLGLAGAGLRDADGRGVPVPVPVPVPAMAVVRGHYPLRLRLASGRDSGRRESCVVWRTCPVSCRLERSNLSRC